MRRAAKDAALHGHAWLVWRTRPLLPALLDTAPRELLSAFSLRAPPPLAIVQNLVSVAKGWAGAPPKSVAVTARQGVVLLAAVLLSEALLQRGLAPSSCHHALLEAPFIVLDDGTQVTYVAWRSS